MHREHTTIYTVNHIHTGMQLHNAHVQSQSTTPPPLRIESHMSRSGGLISRVERRGRGTGRGGRRVGGGVGGLTTTGGVG